MTTNGTAIFALPNMPRGRGEDPSTAKSVVDTLVPGEPRAE